MTAEELMTKAKIQLLLVQPFFATLLLRLTMRADAKTIEENGGFLFATNGRELIYHPENVHKYSMDELKGALSHEVLHVALGHMLRRGQRDPRGWNYAADLVVNPTILEAGLKLPKESILDTTYAGWFAEAVYDKLPKQPNGGGGKGKSGSGRGQGKGHDQGQSQGQDNGDDNQPDPSNFGAVLDSPAQTPAERAAEERDWRIAVQEAAMAAKAAGRLAGSLARLAESLREPQLDWRAILRRFVEETVMSDYSWRRPNRRYMPLDLYVPTTDKEGMGELVIGTDTSGSIGKKELDAFASEYRMIHEELKPSAMHVVYFDAAVQHVDTFGPGDDFTLNPVGGGGTDFRPVFEWITKQETKPKCLIVLTDLWGSFPKDAPDYPVLWVSTSPNMKAPFGETLRLNVEA